MGKLFVFSIVSIFVKITVLGCSSGLPQMSNGTPVSTPISSSTSSVNSNWKTFSDPMSKYSISYPGDWFSYAFPDSGTDSFRESVLLSDAEGNTNAQTRTLDETARLWIGSYDLKGQKLQNWITENWKWIRGSLEETTVGGSPAFRARFYTAEDGNHIHLIHWVDRDNKSLVLWAQVKTGASDSMQVIERIIESLNLSK